MLLHGGEGIRHGRFPRYWCNDRQELTGDSTG